MKRLYRYKLYWSPTGQCLGEVVAPNERAACRFAPYPWRGFIGEIYAELQSPKIEVLRD